MHLKFLGHLDWRVLSQPSACNDSDMQTLGPTLGESETNFRDFQQSVNAAPASAETSSKQHWQRKQQPQ